MSSSGNDLDPERGRISAEDREELKRRATDLGSRLNEVQLRHAPPAPRPASGAAFGQAFRIAVELVVGVAVGGFIGWVLDRQLGTKPWLLVVFIILGFVAGMLNIIRTAQRMQAEAEPLQRSAPSLKDDEDDR
jgi:ATP synthase protein I